MQADIRRKLQETWGNEMRVFETIREIAPRDTIFSLDPTVPTSRASRCLPIYQPRTFMHPHGWAGLGFAFPAGLGAKTGRPQSPVICITGDGGFQYNFQELATAAQYDLHPVILMFNDNAWGVLKKYQQDRYGDRRRFATDLVNPDFAKLFDSYGFNATRVTTLAELAPALEAALSYAKTHLVEVAIPNGFAALA